MRCYLSGYCGVKDMVGRSTAATRPEGRGDGEIVARVASLEAGHHWAKAGVMFRETLAAVNDVLRAAPGDLLTRQYDIQGYDVTGLAAVANALLARVRASEVEFAGNRIRYTISIGAAIGEAAMSIDRLLSLAARPDRGR